MRQFLLFCFVAFVATEAAATKFFASGEACEAAVRDGSAEYYTPHSIPAKIEAVKSSGKHDLMRFDAPTCVHGLVAFPQGNHSASMQWVAMKPGDGYYAARSGTEHVVEGSVMDLCANAIDGMRPVVIATAPASRPSVPPTPPASSTPTPGAGPAVNIQNLNVTIAPAGATTREVPVMTGGRFVEYAPAYYQEPGYNYLAAGLVGFALGYGVHGGYSYSPRGYYPHGYYHPHYRPPTRPPVATGRLTAGRLPSTGSLSGGRR